MLGSVVELLYAGVVRGDGAELITATKKKQWVGKGWDY